MLSTALKSYEYCSAAVLLTVTLEDIPIYLSFQ